MDSPSKAVCEIDRDITDDPLKSVKRKSPVGCLILTKQVRSDSIGRVIQNVLIVGEMHLPQWLSSAAVMLALPLFISIVTSYITVRMAIRRFRAEQWWDKKGEAYTQIVNAMAATIDYSERMAERLYDRSDSETYKKLNEEVWDAYRSLRRATTA